MNRLHIAWILNLGFVTGLLPLVVCWTAHAGWHKPAEPSEISPVTPFDAQRYMGRWYEIARLDHRFERDLVAVSAEYRLLDNGKIQVINRGYHPRKDKWKTARGRAKFAGNTDTGYLRVSFFWPFYGDYKIIRLDPQYQWAVVTSGPEYFWILAREPVLNPVLKDVLTRFSAAAGCDVDALIWVDQSRNQEPQESLD